MLHLYSTALFAVIAANASVIFLAITRAAAANSQAAIDAADNRARANAMVATGQQMIQNAQPRPMTTCMPNGIGGVNCY